MIFGLILTLVGIGTIFTAGVGYGVLLSAFGFVLSLIGNAVYGRTQKKQPADAGQITPNPEYSGG